MGPHLHSPDVPSTRTSRRRLLAVAGTGVATSLAGCTGSTTGFRTRTLRPETEDEATETHLVFSDGDDRIAVVSILDRWMREHHRATYPIRTSVWHAKGTLLESLRYEFRPLGTDHPPEFYLGRPGGTPWEPIEFARGDDFRTTVLEIPDLGFQGRGSVTLDLLVDPRTDSDFDLRVDVAATVSSERFFGREYHLDGNLARTLPGYDYFD